MRKFVANVFERGLPNELRDEDSFGFVRDVPIRVQGRAQGQMLGENLVDSVDLEVVNSGNRNDVREVHELTGGGESLNKASTVDLVGFRHNADDRRGAA